MATAKEETNKTKVLVNVYEPLITIMKHKMDAACLKRDAYLDKALRCEAELLREEMETPNSDRAKTYIAENLKQLRLKPLNLLLSQETVESINDVCKEKNVPRDAFINRFCLLLIASDAVLNVLFKEIIDLGRHVELKDIGNPEYGLENLSFKELICCIEGSDMPLSDCYPNKETTGGYTQPVWSRFQPDFYDRDNVLDTIEAFVTCSPFERLRAAILLIVSHYKEENQQFINRNIYNMAFKKGALQTLPDEYNRLRPENTLGFNTFMTDEQISEQESTDKAISNSNEQDKLLAAMRKENQLRPKREKQTRGVTNKSDGEAL